MTLADSNLLVYAAHDPGGPGDPFCQHSGSSCPILKHLNGPLHCGNGARWGWLMR